MSGAGECRDQHDSHLDDRILDARDMAEEIAEAREVRAQNESRPTLNAPPI